MKYFWLSNFFFFCASALVFAQPGWQVGGWAAPGMTRQHTLENGSQFPLWEYPRTRPGFSVGLAVYRKIGKKVWLHTGVGYANRSFASYSPLSQTNSVGSRIVVDTLVSVNETSDLEVPVLLHWRTGKGRVKGVFSSGLVVGSSVRQLEKITGSTGSFPGVSTRNNTFSINHYSVSLGGGVSYDFGKHNTFLLEPTYLLNFSDLVKPSRFLYDKPFRTLQLKLTIVHSFQHLL